MDARRVTDRHGSLEWAIASVPLPGETVSGDLALVEPSQGNYLLAGVDGLGHGPEAAAAAETAARTIVDNAGEPLDALLVLCHRSLGRTRGVAATLARIDARTATLSWVGVGNVEAFLVRNSPGGTRVVDSPVLSGGIVGYDLPRVIVRSANLQPGDLVVMATDGVERAFVQSIRPTHDLTALADRIMASCRTSRDDALVMVTRFRGPPGG